MNTHRDFEELFRLFEENRVDYMIVGGYAVAFHGHPRFTKDIDIFYDAAGGNIERLRQSLIAFGFAESEVPLDAFGKGGTIVTFGVPPLRVDLLSQIDGVDYLTARPGAVRGKYGNVAVTFIGLDDLLKNKLASPRSQDKADAEELARRRA